LKSSFFFQYQYIVKQKGNEVKENDQQGAFVSMYHPILKEQAKIGYQGRNVILDMDDFEISTTREAEKREPGIEDGFSYKTTPLTFQVNRSSAITVVARACAGSNPMILSPF